MSAGTSIGTETDGEAGFTLLELLIAMTVFGLLSVLLVASLKFGTKIWGMSEDAAETASLIRNAQDDLSGLIAGAYPLPVTDADGMHVDFDGRADAITFLSPDRDIPGGMAHVTIDARRDGSSMVLGATQTPELSSDAAYLGKQRTLMRGVQSVAFFYFGNSVPNRAPTWHAEWRNQPRLPLLVRVHIGFADQKRAQWPDLVVAPHVAAAVNTPTNR